LRHCVGAHEEGGAEDYQTPDFERVVALRARTQAIAKNLTDFLRKSDPYAKMIVFCVDQEHADEIESPAWTMAISDRDTKLLSGHEAAEAEAEGAGPEDQGGEVGVRAAIPKARKLAPV